jgi:hypothetical protein
MIRVAIDRSGDGTIRGFTLRGHAEYGEPGQDIVCAGVSAVTFGTVNAAEALLNVRLACEDDQKAGLFKAEVPAVPDAATADRLQLLLESMVVMLKSIEQSYGDYIRILRG